MTDYYIITASGRKFYPLNPRAEDIHVEDIAHALSHVNRFTGHTNQPYSVAQHSVLVSKHTPPGVALWGLLHDASEAYIADLAHPIKRALRDMELLWYDSIEERILHRVAERFGLEWPMPKVVADADTLLLNTEWRDMMPRGTHPGLGFDPTKGLIESIVPWQPATAKWAFLHRYEELV